VRARRRRDFVRLLRHPNRARRLDDWIAEPNRPSLIHGDAWGGNVLIHRDRVAAFVDPAIYFADAEIELAFGTLFATFGEEFFRRYVEHRPLAPGFFELRRDLKFFPPVHAVLAERGVRRSDARRPVG
jgi:fructosamine-3-kinase